MTRIGLTIALAVLAAAAPPAGASGGFLLSFSDGSTPTALSNTAVASNTTGELTVSFHGDPGSGCAVLGVCGYAGTIVWHPSGGYLLIDKYRRHGHISTDVSLNFDQGSGTTPSTSARVTRTTLGGSDGMCADLKSPQGALVIPLRRVTELRLLTVAGSLLSTRCAGPIDGDLAGVGPTAAVPLAAIRRGTRVDLREARSFAGHGFAGTINSTIVMRLGKPEIVNLKPQRSVHGKTRRLRVVSEQFTLVGADGALQAGFAGVPDPTVCGLLDSCGLSGSLGQRVTFRAVPATLTAIGSASRPFVDFKAALGLSRAGRAKGINVSGGLELAVSGPTADLRQGSQRCTDEGVAGRASVLLGIQHGVLDAGFSPVSPPRTRCPGPMLATGGASLLSGSIPLRDANRNLFSIRLDRPTLFEDDGYRGRVGGGLTLVLRRGRVTQQVLPYPVL